MLRLRDLQSQLGVPHFPIKGKRDKIRFIPVNPMALRLVATTNALVLADFRSLA